MSGMYRNIFDLKAWIGILIICFAVVILLQNLDIAPYINMWVFWPVFLIVIGLSQILRPGEARQTLSGSIFVIIGGLFLLNNMNIIDFGFRELWPFLLLLIGFAILRQAMFGSKFKDSENDFINLTFILGGGDHKFNSKMLKGGKVSAIMGGGKIDLTDADIEEDEVSFDVFAFWGGVEIVVPRNWQVNMRAMPILGGAENKTDPDPQGDKPVKHFIVRGTAIMGGMEIKN